MEHRFIRDRDKKMLTRGVCELGFLDISTGAQVAIPPTLLKGLAANTAQHIPRNDISSIFGGGAEPSTSQSSYNRASKAGRCLHTLTHPPERRGTHTRLEKPRPNTTKVVADPTRNLNTELYFHFRRCAILPVMC